MGCQFHFKQCIWRWLKKNLDESCRKSVLREADILCHQETRSSFEKQYRIFQINLKSYPHFLDYFHKQWIVHFEPQCWATFGRIETFSFLKVDFWLNTSNKIEHWHGMIKSEKRSETFQSQKGYQLDQLIKFLFGVSDVGYLYQGSQRKIKSKSKKEGMDGLSSHIISMLKKKKNSKKKEEEQIFFESSDSELPYDELSEKDRYDTSNLLLPRDDEYVFAKYGECGISNSCRFDCFLAIFITVFHNLPILQLPLGTSDNELIEAMKTFANSIIQRNFAHMKILIHQASKESYQIGETGSMERLFLSLNQIPEVTFKKASNRCLCEKQKAVSISLIELTRNEVKDSNDNFTFGILNKLMDHICNCQVSLDFEQLPDVIMASREPGIDATIEELLFIEKATFELHGIVYLQGGHFFPEIKNPKTTKQLQGWFCHDGLLNEGRLAPITHPLKTTPSQYVTMVFYKRMNKNL